MNARIGSIIALALLLAPWFPATALLGGLEGLATLQDGVARRESSNDPDWEGGNQDWRSIEPGETLVLADLTGPGIIQHIWTTMRSEEEAHPRLLTLRMYWDGNEHPSVEAPLGDFFVIGHGMNMPFVSQPVAVSSNGLARNCYWPMPFRTAARITVTNDGKLPTTMFFYYVDWTKLSSFPEDAAYFHAQYRQEYPVAPDSRYLIADIEGRGHYVGTALNVRQRLDNWMGEGDDFFFVDGDEEPTLRGTGLEDYFCDAWGFRQFSYPFYGVPVWEGGESGDRTTAYRWHIPDPVRFTESLRVEIEHTGPTLMPDGTIDGYGVRPDDFASVAFWYQSEPHKPWEPIPTGYDRHYPEDYLADLADSAYIGWWADTLLGSSMLGAGRIDVDDAERGSVAIVNILPADIDVELSFPEYRGVSLDTPQDSVGVPAGRDLSIPLRAKGIDPAAPERISILPFAGAITTEAGGGARADFSGSVLVEALFSPRMLDAALEVDGDLSDWPDLRFSVPVPAQIKGARTVWAGPEDCSWEMDVALHGDYLYVAVSVTDDVMLRNETGQPWLQDGVEIRLTALHGDAQRTSRGEDEMDATLLVAASPRTDTHEQVVWRENDLPEGVRVACVETDSGYVMEAAIPTRWLDEQQGRPWENFRLNVAVNDRDGIPMPAQLWWRPDWRTSATYDGSGTFVRP